MNTGFLKWLKYFAFGVLAAAPIAFLMWSVTESTFVGARADAAPAMSASSSDASDSLCDPREDCGMQATGERGPAK